MNKIDGTWKVKVKSGPRLFRWVFFWFPDVKVIEGDSGYNIMKEVKWGKFKVSQTGGSITLAYRDLPITDIVWFVGENKLTGEFYWKDIETEEDEFIGTFTMTRIIPSSDQ